MRHLTTILRGIGAIIVGLLFVIAVPAALISYVGWPLPTTLPTVERIQLALRSGIDPQILINTLAVIVWVVWFQIVVVLAAEIVAATRGRTARLLPVLPGLQPVVAQLVASITLAAAALGPLRAAPATASPLLETISPATIYQVPNVERAPAAAAPATIPDRSVQPDLPTYRVQRHDTLWSIAETTLGDGRRWSEVREVNNGRTMPDGRDFTLETDRLTPGWLLNLPADATIPDSGSGSPAASEVTVEPGDNFWTIAEATLENTWGRAPTTEETARYWRHLVDVNEARLLPPHDPNLIFPGQRFELPPIPTDSVTELAAPQAPGRTETPKSEVMVAPGDSFWSIAESALTAAWNRTPTTGETRAYWRQVIDSNRDRLSPPHDPNLIHPGQVFLLPPIPNDPHADAQPPDTGARLPRPELLPADPDQPPAAETPNPDIPPGTTLSTPQQETPTAPTTTTDVQEAQVRPQATDSTAKTDGTDESDLLPIASRLAGLGILAAGFVALLRRLRGAQLRHRRPGTVPTPPPAESVATETAMRAAAALDSTEFLDLALRALARDVIEIHISAPQVVGVHITEDTLRLLLWTPHHDPPADWHLDDDGRSWTLSTSTDVARLRHKAERIAAPYPTLVTVGHGDRSQLLLDLEYLGAVQFTGDPDEVAATCFTMATELAASPLADSIQIICVGFGNGLAHLERISVVERISEILPLLETKAAATTQMPAPSPLHGRTSPAGGDTWEPIVVLDPEGVPPDGADRLLAIAHAGRAVAAVVGYPTGNRWRVHVEAETVRIEPLGSTFARRNLTPTEQTAVADLVATAKDLEGLPPELTVDPLVLNQPADETTEPDKPTEPDEPTEGDDGAVRPMPVMKMLSTLRVDGLDGNFPLRKCTELVAYLTFHRHGVEADTLMEALWPEEPPDYGRLNRHTSRARVTLGPGPDGEPLLPYIRDSRYRVSPDLWSDIEEFTSHIRQADRASDTEESDHLRAALELVEGTPFSGAGNGYTWAHTDGIITHTIVAIDNAAHRLARHALMHDDSELATWAARKGLVATGACEECYRNLMRAAIAEGNQVALEAVYAELLAVIDADEGPDASTFLDPETVELYERHTNHKRRAG